MQTRNINKKCKYEESTRVLVIKFQGLHDSISRKVPITEFERKMYHAYERTIRERGHDPFQDPMKMKADT